jgi:predicted porin
MKKTLVALATLSAIGSAFADVDVSGGIKLYGVIDQAVTQQTLKNPSSTSGTTVVYTGMFASQATSRFGFKGTRDLGDGMKARIQGEIQVEPDNATQLPSKNRGTFVGLSKEGSGEVLLGTQETTAYEIFGMDVNGRVEYKPQVWRTTTSNDLQDRANNSLKYVSPDMAGFTVHLHKGFSDSGASPNTFSSYGVKFHKDELKIAIVMDKLENSAASYRFAGIINAGPSKEGTAGTGQSSTALVYAGSGASDLKRQIGSVSYDFGSFSANYLYAKSYTTDLNVGSLTTNTVGIKVPFDKITVATSFGKGTVDSYYTGAVATSAITKDGTLSDWTTGVYYNIDKATNIYFLYSSSSFNGGLQDGNNRTVALGARYNF